MLLITLRVMQRGAYDAVTHEYRVPVLVPAKPSQQEGYATFFRGLVSPTPVRVLRSSDLKNAREHMTRNDAQHFVAMVELTTALQKKVPDPIAVRKAQEKLKTVYEAARQQPTDFYRLIDQQFADDVKKNTDLSPKEAMDVVLGRRPSSWAAKDVRWLVSEELSDKISAFSRLVLWWSGKYFTPAIWCDDMTTAFYVRALLDVVGGKGLRVCPHCSEVFLQQRPDQNYCSVAHREAHRVARWRVMKASKSKRKGAKRGTRQAK